MSKISELLLDIEELHSKSFSPDSISNMTGAPMSFVLDAIQNLEPETTLDESYYSGA